MKFLGTFDYDSEANRYFYRGTSTYFRMARLNFLRSEEVCKLVFVLKSPKKIFFSPEKSFGKKLLKISYYSQFIRS